MDLSELRQNYAKAGLTEEMLDADPVLQFEKWFKQATKAELLEPNAMSLATASAGGIPSIRTVLLKYFDQNGFVFFTNYSSRKSIEIDENGHVALLFPWIPLQRQVKIIGKAEKISRSASLKYFVSRPHGSQLGAWVSQQSSVISSRSILEMKLQEMKSKFSAGKVPLPDFWGGYRVVPEIIEFWQGRPNRLHDRFKYSLQNNIWVAERLAP